MLLLCMSPQFAVADSLKQDAVTVTQQHNVKASGIVTDEAGEPLVGVSVLVKGTTLGSITDLKGRFSLDVPKEALLRFLILVIKHRLSKRRELR